MPTQDEFNINSLSVELPEDMLKTNPELKELMDMLKDLEASFPPNPEQEKPIPVISKEPLPEKISEKVQTKKIENPLVSYLNELQLTELKTEFFELTKEKKIWNSTKGIASIFFICAFIFSLYLFFNFDKLSRNPSWHPAIAQWCSIFSCGAPSSEDLTQIKSSSLILHADVKNKNKLLLDAIIYNHAEFDQPFPYITILLSDQHQTPIAQHKFSPEQYRQGQLRQLTSMPSQQPIHITLSISNPKIPILNYELKFNSSLQNEIKRYHTPHVPQGN